MHTGTHCCDKTHDKTHTQPIAFTEYKAHQAHFQLSFFSMIPNTYKAHQSHFQLSFLFPAIYYI
jgi:hypothetical protein